MLNIGTYIEILNFPLSTGAILYQPDADLHTAVQ